MPIDTLLKATPKNQALAGKPAFLLMIEYTLQECASHSYRMQRRSPRRRQIVMPPLI